MARTRGLSLLRVVYQMFKLLSFFQANVRNHDWYGFLASVVQNVEQRPAHRLGQWYVYMLSPCTLIYFQIYDFSHTLGIGPSFQPYLGALRESKVKGRWLSCLTESDLADLGVEKVGHKRLILAAVESLLEDVAGLDTDNMQSVLFSLVRSLGVVSSLLKQVRSQPDDVELEHLMVKALVRLGRQAKKAASWLGRSPFSQISKTAALRDVILQNVADLNTVLQSAMSNASLTTYVNAMQELVRGLKTRLEEVIRDCDDSLMLTPCSVELLTLKKVEAASYVGFIHQGTLCSSCKLILHFLSF